MLTTWYTEHAVDFIKRNKANPFLLYVPHSMPHVPLFAQREVQGQVGHGVYGDVMMEMDWSVGEIMKALKANGLDDNTMVFMSSDNGPWTSTATMPARRHSARRRARVSTAEPAALAL